MLLKSRKAGARATWALIVTLGCLAPGAPAQQATSDGEDAAEARAAQETDARARAQTDREHATEQAERLEEAYERATEALDSGQIERALETFDRVAAGKGRKSDAALYWKAYALQKRGRRPEALATLERLKSEHPQSRWLKDGQALELEIRQKGGEKPNLDALADDELKIVALSGLMGTDQAHALPLLEKLIASGKSARVREHALFVLSQSGSPRAREIVAGIARGQGSPALESKAIEYLGILGGPESQKLLAEIYAQSSDPDSRRAVLRSFMISGDKARLVQAARTEKLPELRREAVHLLGALQAKAELAELYTSEADREVKGGILQGMMMTRDASRLIQIARSEKDPELRRQAVQMLSVMDSKEGRQFLLELLEK